MEERTREILMQRWNLLDSRHSPWLEGQKSSDTIVASHKLIITTCSDALTETNFDFVFAFDLCYLASYSDVKILI